MDFRVSKGTLRLHHLRGKSPAAVEIELSIAIVAYGLVRACMTLAVGRGGLEPRRLSFTQCYGRLNDMLPKRYSPLAAKRPQAFDRMLGFMARAKLPQGRKLGSILEKCGVTDKAFPTGGPQRRRSRKTK